ncbi:hypothetical protein CERZMDRAFT_91966, partial [Cercospora zeae-maydis SCOH1-5]
ETPQTPLFSHPPDLGETGLSNVLPLECEEYEYDLDLCDEDRGNDAAVVVVVVVVIVLVLVRCRGKEATYTDEDLRGRPSDVVAVIVELRFLTYSRRASPK